MNEFTNTDQTRTEFVRRVNSGEVTEVGGREVWSQFGERSSTWQNGSVSVNVRGRNSRTQGTVWVREGQTVTFR